MRASPSQATTGFAWLPTLALLALTVYEGLLIGGAGLVGEGSRGTLLCRLALPLTGSAVAAVGLGAVGAPWARFAAGLALALGFPFCVGMLALAGIPSQIAAGGSVWQNVRFASLAFTVSWVPLVVALAARGVRRLLCGPG